MSQQDFKWHWQHLLVRVSVHLYFCLPEPSSLQDRGYVPQILEETVSDVRNVHIFHRSTIVVEYW